MWILSLLHLLNEFFHCEVDLFLFNDPTFEQDIPISESVQYPPYC